MRQRPRPIRTKADLALVLVHASPTAACEKQVRENDFILLGGFTPAKDLPRWIARVKAPIAGKTWWLYVSIDEHSDLPFKTGWYLTEGDVPWVAWDGQSTGRNILIDGEEPLECAMKRMEARRD